MGMWDKDKQYGNRLDQAFALGEQFIVWAAEMTGEEIATSVGDAAVARLTVATTDKPGEKFDVTTVASGIVEKVENASEGDFPVVVELRRVESKKFKTKALVLQWIRDYES